MHGIVGARASGDAGAILDGADAIAARHSAADRLERLPFCNYHRLLFFVLSTAFFFDNFDLATMTFLLGSIRSDLTLSSAQAGFVGSASFVGMAFGALTSGILADRFGRKPVFQFSMVVWGLGSLLCATAHGAGTLAAYRLILGLGMGMELPLAQTLLSEFLPARQRGRYLALMDGNWPLAFICAGTVSYFVVPAYGWRAMFVVGAVPALFLIVLRVLVPESPRWLESRGHVARSDAVVARFEERVRASTGLARLPDVVATFAAQSAAGGGLAVLWSKAYRGRTAVAAALWFLALLGFYGLNTWIGALLQQSGLGVAKSMLFTVWIATGGVPGFVWAAWAVDAWGRKPTCVATLGGGAVMAFVFGQVLGSHQGTAYAIVAGVAMQFFLFGMWAVLYTYTPELYPSRARASGCGFSSFAGRLGALIGPATVGLVLPMAGQTGIFALGAACFGIAALAVLLFGDETRAMRLEAISQ